MAPNALIFEKAVGLCEDLKRYGDAFGLDISQISSRNKLMDRVKAASPDIIFLAFSGRGIPDGIRSVEEIRRLNSEVPIIFITQRSSEDLAVAAFRAGITDYFKVPICWDELKSRIGKSLSRQPWRCSRKVATPLSCGDDPLIGDSVTMREVRDYLHLVAGTDSTVLITGETGTGKELAARTIHNCSRRKRKPFVCVNCAALPESLIESELFGYERGAFTGAVDAKPGKFELAEGGSIFLDEIGEMNLQAQAKVLRCTDRKEVSRLGGKNGIPVNVRVIAATNRNPEELVSSGLFREDLFYRLNVVRIHLPPLRDRRDDIPKLARHVITGLNELHHAEIQRFSSEAMVSLMRYDWPGNVRELMNVLEATYIDPPAEEITFANLPKPFRMKLELAPQPDRNERHRIETELIAAKWNKTVAARKLNWSRMTLYRKIAKYNIVEPGQPPL